METRRVKLVKLSRDYGMKILLINPNPSRSSDVGEFPMSAPLGLAYIAAALRGAGYGCVNIVDARALDLSHDDVLERVRSFTPDIVGISGMSVEADEIHELAGLIKKTVANCYVALGGAYASSSPGNIIQDPNIDFIVVGEGERTICELVHALEHGRDLHGIAGLAFRHGDKPVFNPRRAEIEDVDSIPFPAWDLLPMETYFEPTRRHALNPILASKRVLPIFTSRGCPFGCIYCHNIFGKRTRLRSVGNVIREIEFLIERYGLEQIEIWDDIFNYDLERAKRICDEIIRRDMKITLSFPNALRVDGMDEELIAKLKKAGTKLLFYAVESASPRIQEQIGKKLDLVKARKMIRLTFDSGIVTNGFFMLGFPGETREEMLETIRFAEKGPFHVVEFFYVTPRPNTPLHKTLKAKTAVHPQPAHYKKFSVNLSAVSDIGLKRMWAMAHLRF